jgi:AraC family ethanolamine operon transcriptional activator
MAEGALQEFAEHSILLAQQSARNEIGRPSLSRRGILAATANNAGGPAESLYVRNLARSARVSERTLRRAFHDWFRTSPARYARLRQLHVARGLLLAADPVECTVTAVLTACGIFELGRFAGEYRKLFGELPSQTLHSAGGARARAKATRPPRRLNRVH